VIVAEDGTAKLLDFGLAKLTDAAQDLGEPGPALPGDAARVAGDGPSTAAIERARADGATLPPDASLGFSLGRDLTRVGTIMGTSDYMPPEIWRGEPASRRSDVYSLGAVLYELCSGHAPHEDLPDRDLPRAVQERDARLLRDVAAGVDPRLEPSSTAAFAAAPASGSRPATSCARPWRSSRAPRVAPPSRRGIPIEGCAPSRPSTRRSSSAEARRSG
jgi:serine/threonine protein kinase